MNRRLAIKLLIAAVLGMAGLYALVRLDNWNALRQVEQTPAPAPGTSDQTPAVNP